MACPSKPQNQPVHVRSISMPSSHQPIAIEVEKELEKLRTSVAPVSSTTLQMVCNGLREIVNVYSSIEMILRLPSTQQALSDNNQKKWVEEELDQSIKILDLCTVMRDNLVATKEHAQGLDLASRRKGAVSNSKLQAYILSQKKAQREIKNIFKSLKQTNKSIPNVPMVIKVLFDAREVLVSLLVALSSLLFVKAKGKQKESRWPFVSKTLQQRKVACDDELECTSKAESLEDLETGLDCLFRRLILNRVSLLNIISL